MFEEVLSPVPLDEINDGKEFQDNHIGKNIAIHTSSHFPGLEDVKLALIGVCDDRKAKGNEGCAAAPDVVRSRLYYLNCGDLPLQMADLGNIMPGSDIADTYAALGTIVGELLEQKVIPIIIGGGHDITYGQYLGYKKNEQVANLVVIDESIDIYKHEEQIDSHSFLYRLFTETPNYLFNFSQIGYQSYFVSPEDINTLEKLYFEFYRLGNVQENLEEAEPIIRDADMVSFDVNAIRQSDAPGRRDASPNGFYGEEACRIARYAGITDKVSSFGIYEFNPTFDPYGQTAQLLAQMIWYFIEGYYARTNDLPVGDEKDFVKYIVNFEETDYELVFWKSKRSGRWWMQVPDVMDTKYERHQLIPCSYADYELACKEEIPERWLRAHEKVL